MIGRREVEGKKGMKMTTVSAKPQIFWLNKTTIAVLDGEDEGDEEERENATLTTLAEDLRGEVIGLT